MSSTSENIDRLSSLPEDVLTHILSQLPTKLAVRTSILSKRWRYSWTSVTNLDFDGYHPADGFYSLTTFVDRVLELCKTTQVNKFRLHFNEIWAQKSSVSKWIDEAVRLNVRELDVQVILLELPVSLFTCKTLTRLNLDCCVLDMEIWECLSFISLPCLKNLRVVVPRNPSVSVLKLVRGCPVLESLFLQVDWRDGEEEFNFNIPTLKRLMLHMPECKSVINKVVLNVPNLEYLCVGGVLCSLFVMEDLSSFVEASFCISEVRFNHLWGELLKGISGVKSLAWSGLTDDVPSTSYMPVFPNLKRLEFVMPFRWVLIPQILERTPELEHLCIDKLEESCWIEPKSVPTCMLTNLRTIKFTNYKGQECDIQFLKYMLGNAVVLKTLTITCEGSCLRERKERKLYKNLLKLSRASRYCEIHFVGKWFKSTTR